MNAFLPPASSDYTHTAGPSFNKPASETDVSMPGHVVNVGNHLSYQGMIMTHRAVFISEPPLVFNPGQVISFVQPYHMCLKVNQRISITELKLVC